MVAQLINIENYLRPATRKQVREIAKQEELRTKTAPTFSSSSQYMHGPQGLLNQPGVDRTIISTLYRPVGISRHIPAYPSNDISPFFKMLTSQATDSGSEPSDVCSTPVTSGKLTEMQLTAPFGLLKRGTETLSMDRLGQIVNNAEPMDLALLNQPENMSIWTPEATRNLQLNDELRMQYYRLGLSIDRKQEVDTFQGAGSNQGTTQGYRAYFGLDNLINSGKKDVVTGALVPAADALIVPWGNAQYNTSQSIMGTSMDLVTLVSNVDRYLSDKADKTGTSPVTWGMVLRSDLFWWLTSIWPCSYLTNSCTTGVLNGATQFVTGDQQVRMRDDMRNGQFLWVNGKQYPVILTDGNVETGIAAGAKSDIYFVPFSAHGMVTLYYHYFNFQNPQAAAVIAQLPQATYTITDGGKYIWTYNRDSFCVNYEAMVLSRLVLRTAFLSARITNVGYPTAFHSFNAYPSDTYFQQGGGSTVGSYNPAALYTSGVY